MADAVFPVTIDDTSPLVLYSPFRDIFTGSPAITAGWNSFDTSSGFAESPSGPGSPLGPSVANGTSLHLTAADGAALQLSWNGTSADPHGFPCCVSATSQGKGGIEAGMLLTWSCTLGTDITIFGTLVQPSNDVDVSYTVTLDGTATTNYISNISQVPTVDTAANDVLVAFTGLPEGLHSIQVTLHNPGPSDSPANSTAGPLLAFDRALVDVSAGKPSSPSATPSSGTSASPTPSVTALTAPVPDDQIAYRGQWNFTPDLLPGKTASFHTSTNVGDKATLLFNAGSAVGLTGLTTPASGAYNVSVDSEEPVTLSARASFTASSPTLLYFRTGLDPNAMHIIEVVNAGPSGAGDDAGSLLVLAAVNVTTVESAGGSPVTGAGTSSGLSKGAIAALAIGITLAVAALLVAVLFFVRQRRRRERRKREMLVNPRINRAGRLSFLFPHKRFSQGGHRAVQKGSGRQTEGQGVLDIRSSHPDVREKHEESEAEDGRDGEGDNDSEPGERRFSAAEKGKGPATGRSSASKNSDGSYSIDLPDLTIAQVPRGYLPASTVPSTPSPPRTIPGSLASPRGALRPRGPREMQGRDAARGILLTHLDTATVSAAEENGVVAASPPYLPEAHISPLRVEFASELRERPDRRTERHISTATSASLPPSLKQALSQQRTSELPISIAPSPTRPEPVYSFLDFNSSTSTSLSRSQRHSSSNSTGKSRSSSRSKRNTGSEHSAQTQSVNWADLPPDRRVSLGLSITIADAATASRPSLSPNVSLQPVPLPPPVPPLPAIHTDQQPSSSESGEPEGPDQPYPYDAAGGPLPSPTDSIPFTVSDIHFRHSTHSSVSGIPESRRASAQQRLSGSHRLPHPPLPGITSGPSSPTRPTHGPQDSAAGGSQTAPPFIVQRILGRAPGSTSVTPFGSPTTPQFASITGTIGRTGGPTTPASASCTPPPPQVGGTGSSSGQGQAPGSSSTTTVFGFQLGRHR
ncbi:hypothetical protein BD414DRAFT_411509 [Trametes punicea]|nr:hypothetical protein BD414DRAFT_411509 [Trametes punicea]